MTKHHIPILMALALLASPAAAQDKNDHKKDMHEQIKGMHGDMKGMHDKKMEKMHGKDKGTKAKPANPGSEHDHKK
jgi:hypothetical protein